MFKIKVVSMLALVLIAGMAQARPGGEGPRGMPGMSGGNGGGVERMVQHLWRAADELGITDQQMDQIFAVVDASRNDIRNAMSGVHDNRQALRDAVHADPYDANAVAALAAAHGQLAAEMIILNSQVRADVRAILTPDQRNMIDQFRGQRCAMSGIGC